MSDARDIIEQLLKRSRGPRGPNGPRTITPNAPHISLKAVLIGLLALLVVWSAKSAFYTVQPDERGVVKRFGRVIGIADNGWHFKLPFGVDSVQVVATERVLKQEFGFRSERPDRNRTQFAGGYPEESLMLTGDLNIIQVEWVVQYRIDDPVKYLYGMRDSTKTLRDLSESVVRRIVGNRIGSDVLTVGRIEIATSARDEIQDAMQRYDNGVKVITVQLQDVVPPMRVKPAFNQVNEARQQLERTVNDATKQANEAIPKAEGTAKRTVAEAEGYATERVNRAHGDVAAFNAVLAEYKRVPEVTRTRLYLEALDKVLPKIGSVVVVQDGQLNPLPLLNLRDAQKSPQKTEATR
jgi:membrane protease subunit HflK